MYDLVKKSVLRGGVRMSDGASGSELFYLVQYRDGFYKAGVTSRPHGRLKQLCHLAHPTNRPESRGEANPISLLCMVESSPANDDTGGISYGRVVEGLLVKVNKQYMKDQCTPGRNVGGTKYSEFFGRLPRNLVAFLVGIDRLGHDEFAVCKQIIRDNQDQIRPTLHHLKMIEDGHSSISCDFA